MTEEEEISEKLKAYRNGDLGVLNELVPLLYDELHRRAHNCLRNERSNHTLQTTALVNEAYERLAHQHSPNVRNRSHFLAVAGTIMRWILVNYAKERKREKRGGKEENISLDDALFVYVDEMDIDILALDDALNSLEEKDERQAKIVDRRFFGGLSIEETAEDLNIAPATVKREWQMARAWLHSVLDVNK